MLESLLIWDAKVVYYIQQLTLHTVPYLENIASRCSQVSCIDLLTLFILPKNVPPPTAWRPSLLLHSGFPFNVLVCWTLGWRVYSGNCCDGRVG